jgi:SPX domain protein involved in polyphosphate accumulation
MERAASNRSAPRYERKFAVAELSRREIEASLRLHPAMFSEIYRARNVNNFYFDTPDGKFYHENVSGVSTRAKFRVRWYGDLLGRAEKPVLEIKHKQGHVGWKDSYPLPSFEVTREFDVAGFMRSLRKSSLPGEVRADLLTLELRLMNRYRRRYFRSADKRFRITVDTELEWYRVNPKFNNFLVRSRDRSQVIVELKYAYEHDAAAPEISEHFPFRLTRSSKYVSGVDAISPG